MLREKVRLSNRSGVTGKGRLSNRSGVTGKERSADVQVAREKGSYMSYMEREGGRTGWRAGRIVSPRPAGVGRAASQINYCRKEERTGNRSEDMKQSRSMQVIARRKVRKKAGVGAESVEYAGKR